MRNLGEVSLAFALAIVAIVLGAVLALRLGGGTTAAEAARAWENPRLIRTSAEAEAAEADKDNADKQKQSSEEEGKLSREQVEQRKRELSDEQNYVCFQKGTEAPFSGKYYDHHEAGMYVCVVCQNPLFASDTKFDSGTGWPSFWEMAEDGHVATHEDRSHGMVRTEVICANCGSHLGHVFDDGPKPTGLRYCINSLSLDFVSAEDWKQRVADGRDKPRMIEEESGK